MDRESTRAANTVQGRPLLDFNHSQAIVHMGCDTGRCFFDGLRRYGSAQLSVYVHSSFTFHDETRKHRAALPRKPRGAVDASVMELRRSQI